MTQYLVKTHSCKHQLFIFSVSFQIVKNLQVHFERMLREYILMFILINAYTAQFNRLLSLPNMVGLVKLEALNLSQPSDQSQQLLLGSL